MLFQCSYDQNQGCQVTNDPLPTVAVKSLAYQSADGSQAASIASTRYATRIRHSKEPFPLGQQKMPANMSRIERAFLSDCFTSRLIQRLSH